MLYFQVTFKIQSVPLKYWLVLCWLCAQPLAKRLQQAVHTTPTRHTLSIFKLLVI